MIISNTKINDENLSLAQTIILNMQKDIKNYTKDGFGPFVAEIYQDNQLIAKGVNSVVKDNNCLAHAEMNAIKLAQEKLNSRDLSSCNLKIYITAEPCIMCLGAIMWSGIKEVYFGVASKKVEEITGFDEGFKPNWFDEFKKRGILVYGNIEAEYGESELMDYVKSGKVIYKPKR